MQGEPKFGRWDAALKSEYAALQDPSGKPPPRSRQDVVTDHSGVLEKFEGLGAVLRVGHAPASCASGHLASCKLAFLPTSHLQQSIQCEQACVNSPTVTAAEATCKVVSM